MLPRADVAGAVRAGRFPFCSWATNGMWVFPARNGAVKIGDGYPRAPCGIPRSGCCPTPPIREQLSTSRSRFRLLRDAALMQERVCFYDCSPDGDFVLTSGTPTRGCSSPAASAATASSSGPGGQPLARYALSGRDRRPGAVQPGPLHAAAGLRAPGRRRRLLTPGRLRPQLDRMVHGLTGLLAVSSLSRGLAPRRPECPLRARIGPHCSGTPHDGCSVVALCAVRLAYAAGVAGWSPKEQGHGRGECGAVRAAGSTAR